MPSCHNNIEAHTNSNNYSQFGGSRKKRRSTRRRSTRRRSNLKIDESTYSLPSFTLLST